ncbi:MAG TPA: LLM class flavin-dependent oxidoreductase, partial [Candidatus Binataceae bacterium]|nr:LLM class flavin-dependent oxidoreductase [Candidatus Binataceae bacterium]
VAEAWGRDAFTLLAILADHTKRVRLASSIVNTYSRTPAALAQHFATLDEVSGGRMIVGLGTSGPQVIEHFHGVRFEPALTRLKEYADIIDMLMAGVPLNYNGKIFKLNRGFKLRFEPPRKHIPIFIASLNRKSVEFTAQRADGWLPVLIPLSQLGSAITDLRAIAVSAGRDPGALAVRAPGVVHVTSDVARSRASLAGNIAFYIARMGTFYGEQLTRWGWGKVVQPVRDAWAAGGAKAGAAAVPTGLVDELGYSGSVEGAIERMQMQEAAGIDIHGVEIDSGGDLHALERDLRALVG